MDADLLQRFNPEVLAACRVYDSTTNPTYLLLNKSVEVLKSFCGLQGTF